MKELKTNKKKIQERYQISCPILISSTEHRNYNQAINNWSFLVVTLQIVKFPLWKNVKLKKKEKSLAQKMPVLKCKCRKTAMEGTEGKQWHKKL